jgi:hypothetical protein
LRGIFLNKIIKNRNNRYIYVMKGRIKMPNLTQMELQNLRHLIGSHDTSYQKLNSYASNAVDPQIKQMFTKSAQEALTTKQKLLTFLNN